MASATEGLGNALVNAGAGLADKERREQEEQDRLNVAKAKSAFLRAKVTADSAFDDDQDFTTYATRYQEMLKPATEQALSVVKDPKRREALEDELGVEELRGVERMADKARAKHKDTERGNTLTTINNNMDVALRSADPVTQEKLARESMAALDAAKERGYFTAEEHANKRREVGESFAIRSIQALPPEQQLKVLAPQTGSGIAPVPNDYFGRLAKVESNNDPKAQNKSGASGLYQFMPETAKQYGLADPTDPVAARSAVERLTEDNRASLSKSLGREPGETELYLAHQQGAAGAAALLKGGDQPAVEVLAPLYKGGRPAAAKAITQNGGSVDMTAKEFAVLQQQRFDKAGGEVQVASNAGTYDFQTKTGNIVDLLPADKRMLMIEQAQNKMKEGQTAFRADVATRYDAGLADIRANGSTTTVSEGEIRAAYSDNPLKADLMIRNLREEKTFFGAKEAVKLATPAETALMLQNWKPQGEMAAFTAPRYEALVRAVTEKNRLLQEDPGGYAINVSPQLQSAYSAAAADPKQLPKALELSDQIQNQLGVPSFDRRLLGKTQAETTVRQVMSLKGEKMADAMEGLAVQYGSYWPQVFRELKEHKLPDNMSVVATVDSPVARQKISEAFTAESERPGALRQLAGQDAKGIDDDVASEMADFRQSMASAPNGTQIVDRYQDTAKLLAYKYVSQGMKPSQAAKQAAKDVVLDKYDFGTYGGMTVRAPKGKLGEAERWARTTLAGLDPESLDIPPPRPGEPLTIQQRQQSYAQAVKRGSWVSNENDDGWMLLDPAGRPVKTRAGLKVGFKFSEIGAPPVSTPSLDFVAP